MVQRKVSNNNKLSLYIQPKTTLITDSASKHVSLKPSLQNHDAKTKASDLKAIKMKKSRSIKRPDVELARRPTTKTRLREPPPQAPPPIKTPNYMKSTNSSELHKVEKTKTKSSFNKVRTLTRAPTFKHSKTLGTKTHYFDAKRATCSSTLKDYKFPSYLKLTHGATEGKGTSVMKVCPYTYCSLNGHHHNTPAPPLKSFLSSRRKMLKTQKNVDFEVNSPRKKVSGFEAGFVLEDRKDDFFVKIHVPRRELEPDQVSEVEFECRNNESDSDSCVSSDRNLSDMEWVEGNTQGFEDEKDEVLALKYGIEDEKLEVSVSKDCGGDEFEPGLELDGEVVRYVYDEIVEFMLFSDAETASDSESTQTEDCTAEQIVVEETVCSADENDSRFLNPIEEVIEAHNESLHSFEENDEAKIYESNEGGDNADDVVEETRSSDILVEDIPWEASHIDGASEVENTDGASLDIVDKGKLFSAEDVADSYEVKLDPIENDIEELEPLPAIRNEAEEVDEGISNKEHESIDILSDICSKLKKSVRRKQANEDSEEDRDFNPRAPNFLPVEPELEAEKVDLRHQDMDERRNAEDWMLDHALQKTVNQLAPARRRKVALLVEAFETVLPIPTYEPHMRRNLSVFPHSRTVQACR